MAAHHKRIDIRILVNIMEYIRQSMAHTYTFIGKYVGIHSSQIGRYLNGTTNYVNEEFLFKATKPMAEKLLTYVKDFGTKEEYKAAKDSLKEIKVTVQREKFGESSTYPTIRSGPAHLAINEMIICGADPETARYYRSHEYFLNQPEICPICLEWLMKVVNAQAKKTCQKTIQVS